ncbi:MAG: hypothetical protein JNM42_00035 [Propionivibrio sp.]|uniref:PilC/PilY family type IV pilus protein n=1 Tax=Propionivibrio sp. TaxID=2212460 RepID=UPI001A4D2743|nr:PilC/PilY family type IV pilus protein [Propionivibrio sp.]MBL8412811.1 hypothetical protein [Propionivibrio sp.]
MTTNASFIVSTGIETLKRISRIIGGVLLSAVLVANAHGAATALATEPITLSTKINALPNVMFVLDDSGSMGADYLPDWAGPYQATISSVLTVITPAHRFFNGAYNGVAYNPATRYRPPVMYDNTGALDTTTYPSQTGQSPATGGDGSATALLPNWRAVKVDGYGIQSAATANLEDNAFSYTTVPGEYCTSGQLRTCIASAAPSGAYTFPAKLRWCTTSALSVDTTANAGTACQASNIADTPTNTANGVTNYTFPRMPRPHTANITIGAAGTVTSITVDGLQILSAASVTGGTSTDLATAIAASINACTLARTGVVCQVVGYSAVSLADVVTITAPAATSSTPVVTGGTTTPGAFSNGNVPGSSLFTVITPTVASYPYPGSAVKDTNRTDCAGSTCTYAEEMTNYANWYAYYRTRMQMMKTASSIAFSAVDDKFRVGYYSINNGAGSQFLNVSAFDGPQKNLWYTKFLNAVPFGATPLRTGLSTIGRMYAGQLSTLNTLPVNEPMQYSCQQNFTILSTDGYWNDTSDPVRIDGTTAIGQQDGSLDRPYYDGGTQTKTVSQTNKTEEQLGINTFLVESRTQQQQSSSSRLTQSVVTTTTYPWTTETTTLQTRTTPLNQSKYMLESRSYPLTSNTKQLQESTFKLDSTPRILQSYINNLTKTTTPLEARTYNVTVKTQLLTKKDYNVTVNTQLLTKKDYNVTVNTQLLTKKDYNLTTTTSALQSSTFMLQSSTRQLQKRNEYSTDGGDTWQSTGWVNASSCTVRANGPGWVRNTQCRYNTAVVAGNLGSCTSVAASVAPTYTVAQAVSCAYETTPVVADVGTCNVVAQSGSSPYTPSVSCGYSATPTVATGQASCTANDQTGAAAMTGNKVVCAYDTTPTTTTDLSSCTWKVPAVAASAPKTDCSYQTATPQTGQATCTAAANGTLTTNNTVWNTGVACSYDATPTTTSNLASCTWRVPAVAASAPKTDCSYQTATPQTGQATCSAAAKGTVTTNNTVWNTGVACSYDATPTTATNLASCTWKVPAVAASAPKTDCSYQSATTQTGQASCTAAANGTVTTDTTVWNKGVACSYDASPATTLTNQSSCTWVVPATAASLPKTDCVYNAAAATSSTVASCTAVAASTGTSNGTVWAGPTVTCAYAPAVLTGTNLTTCTAGSPGGGLAYTTCGYINGTTTTGLNSCTYVADSPGPVNYTGPANACAYSATAIVANVASCTPVAQSGTFAAPQKTCAYETVGTDATNLTTCTTVAQSGSAPYAGPAVSCAYSGTVGATDLNASTCTVHDSGGSPYTGGAKVACAYNATPVVSNDVASCTTVAQSVATTNGTVYSPAYTCAYGTTTGYTDATVACVPVAQSGGPSFVGPARECAYTTPSVDTFTGTCTPAAQDNTNLTAINCVAGSFPVVGAAVDSTVDTCSTAATSSGSPVVVSTATTCTYQAPVTVNTATCTPVTASVASPYVTAVTCQVSDSGYVAVAPTCTPVGTPPASFDASGTLVECRTTNQIGTAAAPVPAVSCTPGTDAGTMVQTNCTSLLSTGPTPVDPATCTTVNPGVAPDYVKTLCTTTNTASTVMGCGTQTATPPLWQTVTCADIAGSGTTNTLADVAAYYYYTDLRTPALGNCTGAIVPPAVTGGALCPATGPDTMNNVPTTSRDPLNTQHMTTFTLGLGASGYMKYSDTYLTDTSGDYSTVYGVAPHAPANGIAADPSNGVCSWQSTGNCNWPFPASDEQTTIDDLWHAGVNGHGAYFSATDPKSLSKSISSALAGVAAAGGASASPTISNPSLTPADNYIFISTYTTSDWTGELVRRQLDPFTGAVSATPDWAAQGKLDAKTPASRNIYTFDSSVAVTKLKAFTSANFAGNVNFLTPHISTSPSGLTQFLCASVDTCLSATDQDNANALGATGANLVNFLRGVRTNEGAIDDNNKFYRQRQSVLGDMVNAETVYVNKPVDNFADAGYSDFVTAQATRQAVVYSASNDGMLHAFAAKGDAATEALVEAAAAASEAYYLNPTTALKTAADAAALSAATAVGADTTIGQELWAYIPSMVIPNLYRLADKNYSNKHRPFVDASPVVGDICVSNCSTAAATDWRTILVGGLGRGGRGYYALDITVPSSPKALWEFTNADLGYTFGNPQIVKMCDDATCTTKTWVVLVTSGYNNIPNEDGATGDGIGRLFVLNAATGSLIRAISTGVGDSTSPSGLAKITAQVINPSSDNTAEAVYGGDLYGNLWRFDINDTIGGGGDANDNYDAQLLAILKDGAGNLQPITTKPEVGYIPKANVKVVFVGTGRFLAGSDASDTSQQSLYAIKDVRAAGTTPATAIFNNPGGAPRALGLNATTGFVQQVQSEINCPVGASANICDPTLVPTPKVLSSTNNPVDFSSDNGWFVDLINASERANTDPALALGVLVYNTNAPSLAACDVGGKSYQYWLNYETGGPLAAPGTFAVVGFKLLDGLASKPVFAMDKTGNLIVYTGCSGPDCPKKTDPTDPPLKSVTRRTSWRELIREQ